MKKLIILGSIVLSALLLTFSFSAPHRISAEENYMSLYKSFNNFNGYDYDNTYENVDYDAYYYRVGVYLYNSNNIRVASFTDVSTHRDYSSYVVCRTLFDDYLDNISTLVDSHSDYAWGVLVGIDKDINSGVVTTFMTPFFSNNYRNFYLDFDFTLTASAMSYNLTADAYCLIDGYQYTINNFQIVGYDFLTDNVNPSYVFKYQRYNFYYPAGGGSNYLTYYYSSDLYSYSYYGNNTDENIIGLVGYENGSTNNGYMQGYQEGYDYGYSSSRDYFYNLGYDDGHLVGTNVGFNNGYEQGQLVGYQEGAAAANTYTFTSLFGAIADTPILIVRSMFDFDFFGVNLLAVILSLFTAFILFFIFKKLIK